MNRKLLSNRMIVGLVLAVTLLMVFSPYMSYTGGQVLEEKASHLPVKTDKPLGESRDAPPAYTYSRQAAYGYAYKWYDGRNTAHYNDYSGSGGDCANFVSQCLIAGGLSLHEGTNGQGYGVYPDRDRSSSSHGTIPFCDYLNLHLKNYQNAEITYVTEDNIYIPSNIQVGDVVIFGDKDGDKYKHAMIVRGVNNGDLLLAGHSSNDWDGTINGYLSSSSFSCVTFYHIPTSQATMKVFKVTTSTLNVRVGPGKNELGNYYEDIGDIHSGEMYVAFGYATDSDGNKWWHFWYDDRAAWCAAWYTQEVTDAAVLEVDVNAYLNVRSGPSTSDSIVGQTYDGMRFVAISQSGEWYKYYYGGRTAYSHGSYMNLISGEVSSSNDGGGNEIPPPSGGGPLYGIDVSHWQGTVDWQKVKEDGKTFAFCKATESTSYVDDTFATNMQNARSAGIYIGAYHFARPTRNSPEAEAQHFASTISPYLGSGYLRPVLDLEDGSSLGRTALTNWVHDFMNKMIELTGVMPILYLNPNYATNYVDSSVTKYPLWIAHYTSASQPSTSPWPSWDFWQYSDKGSVKGVYGNVDVNKFNGDLNRLLTYFSATGGDSPTPNSAPVADAGSDRTIKVGTTVTFDASGSYDTDGTITKYTWSFGDGTSAEGASVSHTYNTPGTYTVTLTVTDNDNAVTTDSCIITVKDNVPPTADAGPDKTVTAGDSVSFNGAGSSDSDGSVDSYSWDFGDGTSAEGASVSHTYNTPGTYTVTLTVTDNEGAQGTDVCIVTVLAQQPTTQAPVANAGSDRTVNTGDQITFDGSGSSDSDGTIVSYLWDFGDGSTATGSSVKHSYAQPGTYMVTLTVTDNDGLTSTDTCKVTVQNNTSSTPGFGMDIGLASLGLALLLLVAGRRKREE